MSSDPDRADGGRPPAETRVLVVCIAPQWIPSLVQLAGDIAKDGSHRFLFAHPASLDQGLVDRIVSGNHESRSFGGARSAAGAPAAPGPDAAPAATAAATDAGGGRTGPGAVLRALARRLLALAWTTTPVQMLLERRLGAKLRAGHAEAAGIVAAWRPDAVISFGDRHGGMEACFLKAAREAGLRIIIPYLAYSDREGLVDFRIHHPHFRAGRFASFYYRSARRRYAAQTHQGLLFNAPFEARAYEAFGTLPANPWTMGTGISDFVCIDGLHTRNRYLAYGVPAGKLRIVGDVSSDRLFETYARREATRRALEAKYAVPAGRALIIISLPQFAEHELLPWDRHFQEIEHLMGQAAALGEAILVSLHPKMDRSRYAYLEEKYACRILDERLFDSLPAADMFVAIQSSTVMWAVLCGVRAVVLDFYGFRSQFDFLTSVRIVRAREDLPRALREKLAEGAESFREDWDRLSRESVFDGKTVERYRRVIAEAVAGRGDGGLGPAWMP